MELLTPIAQNADALLECTSSLCPECKKVVDAQLFTRSGQVYLGKICTEHGYSEALVQDDLDWYNNSLRFDKPGATPLRYATQAVSGCPDDCGLCPEHRQHTCLALIEITDNCNMSCPTCFASAGKGSFNLSLPQVETMLEHLIASEGNVELVQISGGEPTLHPQLPEIMKAVKQADISQIMLNTNGIQLAKDKSLVSRLAETKPFIYLQFDGFKPSTYGYLRGREDLLKIKEQALENIHNAGMMAVLVATLVKGVNDDEVNQIFQYGLQHPAVVGVNFQPATFAGRSRSHNPTSRITVPEVIRRLETDSRGVLKMSDFIPVPCPHPTCSACTYLFHDGQNIIPLPRIINVEDYLDYLTNRTLPDVFAPQVQKALEALWSMSAAAGSQKTADSFECAACGIDFSPYAMDLHRHVFMVSIHGFMDEYNFDLTRCKKCCIHQLVPDGRLIPFCVYNNCGYREEIQGKLSRGEL